MKEGMEGRAKKKRKVGGKQEGKTKEGGREERRKGRREYRR